VIAPVLTQWLISGYSWRVAYAVIGTVNIIVVTALAQALKRSPREMGLAPYGDTARQQTGEEPAAAEGLSFGEAVRTGRFWMLGLVMFCFVFTVQVMMAHIAPHAVDVGVSATLAASVVSIYAATSLIGRNLAGFISDRVGSPLALVFHLTAMALALAWLLFSREVWAFYFFAVVYGVAYGGVVPLQTLLTGELFGLRFLGTIMASLMLLASVGGALGAPLAGTIFDVTGSYQTAFITCLTLVALAIILGVLLLRAGKGQQGPDSQQKGTGAL